MNAPGSCNSVFAESTRQGAKLAVRVRLQPEGHPVRALAKALHTWQTLRGSRRVMLTNDHGQVVHTSGLGVEQIERALYETKQIDILDVSSGRKV